MTSELPPLSRTPHIVILDNDQTTGDYDVFFKWLFWLEKTHVKKYLNIAPILVKFIDLFHQYNIFRPGLKQFLQKLLQLKHDKKIDYVVVYTNQCNSATNIYDKSGLQITIPQLLEIIYNSLVGDSLINLRLNRPTSGTTTKSFSRVFDALKIPKEQWNATKTLFFDDLIEHCPQTDDIFGSENAHIKIPDYRIPFNCGLFLKMCRITIENAYGIYKIKTAAIQQDLQWAITISDAIEQNLIIDLLEPYLKTYVLHGDPVQNNFTKYIGHLEKTFNDSDKCMIEA